MSFLSTFVRRLFFVSVLLLGLPSLFMVQAQQDNTETEATTPIISNRFSDGGCLYQKKKDWTKLRVCGSDDPPEAAQLGYCRDDDPLDYMELRIHSQNWESVFFETWILQIVLSEILNVPTSVETSSPNAKVGFYDAVSSFEYGSSDDWICLERGVEVGDCRVVDNSNVKEDDDYQSCCHFIPEVWGGEINTYKEQERLGRIEPAGTLVLFLSMILLFDCTILLCSLELLIFGSYRESSTPLLLDSHTIIYFRSRHGNHRRRTLVHSKIHRIGRSYVAQLHGNIRRRESQKVGRTVPPTNHMERVLFRNLCNQLSKRHNGFPSTHGRRRRWRTLFRSGVVLGAFSENSQERLHFESWKLHGTHFQLSVFVDE
jgi:hypothetical protein